MKNVHNVLHERFKLQYEYLGEEKIVNKITPLVSVVVATYRHARFIAQCLDGIVNQVTKFPIEVIVGEDGSDDGTTELCIQYAEKYPNLIRLFIRDRSLSQYRSVEGNVIRFNGVWNRMSARGKYIAMCEGDDYWIDPLKLQKQVDFLEANPEYGMCYTQCRYFFQNVKRLESKPWGGPSEKFDEFMRNNTVPTLTAVFRRELYQRYEMDVCPNNQSWKMGDYPMWLWMSYVSRVKYMPFVSGVYRVLSSSASHSVDVNQKIEFGLNTIDMLQFFNNKFDYGLKSDYFSYRKNILLLRSYAVHNECSKFFKVWISIVKKCPKMLLQKDMYKYIIFFVFPYMRNKRL